MTKLNTFNIYWSCTNILNTICLDSQVYMRGQCAVSLSGEPPHTGQSVLPLQLIHKYAPGVEGAEGGLSAQLLLILLRTVGQQLCKTSLLEDDNVPRRRKIIAAVSKFLCVSAHFVCFERFIVKHHYCAKRDKTQNKQSLLTQFSVSEDASPHSSIALPQLQFICLNCFYWLPIRPVFQHSNYLCVESQAADSVDEAIRGCGSLPTNLQPNMASTHHKTFLHACRASSDNFLDSRWTPHSPGPEIMRPTPSCPADEDRLKSASVSIRPNAAAVGWIIEFPCDLQTGELFFYDQTVLVCVVSVDSAAGDVCAARASIMLSFSVTLLGASLRCRRRRQQNLHLKLTNILRCYEEA